MLAAGANADEFRDSISEGEDTRDMQLDLASAPASARHEAYANISSLAAAEIKGLGEVAQASLLATPSISVDVAQASTSTSAAVDAGIPAFSASADTSQSRP